MIFCFSGTGNTRWAAECLAEATGERLTLMTDEHTHCTLTPNERIGFFFPVHGWQPPRLVRNFIRRLTFSSEQPLASHYCYALVTCGDSCLLSRAEAARCDCCKHDRRKNCCAKLFHNIFPFKKNR